MTHQTQPTVKTVPIEQINILNPRVRNQKIFQNIVKSIEKVGLKRPITLRKGSSTSDKAYDLICGQGRMEAFIQLGRSAIPALVVDADEEQALIMSLVENLARRQHRTMDLLQGVEILRGKGYSHKIIASKTGLSVEYIKDVALLLEKGEQRLLVAVENGTMPISVAVEIATASSDDVQKALHDAYDKNLLRGKKLIEAKRLIDLRQRFGKAVHQRPSKSSSEKVTARQVLRLYENEVRRKRQLAQKASNTENSMIFITEAMRHLLKDTAFTNLLESEAMTAMPKPLAELCQGKQPALQGV
jgi:ParB family chromosome partitioning protein